MCPKSSGSLIFPNLIVALCLQAGVPLEDNKDVMPNKGAITKRGKNQKGRSASATPLFAKLQSKTPFELQTFSSLNNMRRTIVIFDSNKED